MSILTFEGLMNIYSNANLFTFVIVDNNTCTTVCLQIIKTLRHIDKSFEAGIIILQIIIMHSSTRTVTHTIMLQSMNVTLNIPKLGPSKVCSNPSICLCTNSRL